MQEQNNLIQEVKEKNLRDYKETPRETTKITHIFDAIFYIVMFSLLYYFVFYHYGGSILN